MTLQRRMRPPKDRSALERLRHWAVKWLSARKSALRKPPSNASKLNIPLPPSGARIRFNRQTVQSLRPVAKHWLIATFVALAVTFSSHSAVLAAESDATQYFEAGRLAFEAKNYAAALDAFEAALDAKLQGPAVHYNIGVAAYRLGRYSRAESAFAEVARTPSMAALAHYNLGLVALRRDDTRAATKWFERVTLETDNEGLRSLASAQLAAMPAPPLRDWAGYAALSAGYDDNVSLVSSADILGVSGMGDAFVESQFALTAPVGKPWRFDAGLVLLNYQDLNDFDQIIVQSGATYSRKIGRWTNELGAQLAYTSLDGSAFESRQTLVLQTDTELYSAWRLRGRYRFNIINGLNDFEGIGGHRHEASARLGWEHDPWNIGATYQFDKGELRDPSLSTTRQQLAVSAAHNLGKTWLLACEIAQRHGSYDINGKENRTEFSVAIEKALSATWRLAIRYAHIDNNADLPEFNYREQRVSAGVQAFM